MCEWCVKTAFGFFSFFLDWLLDEYYGSVIIIIIVRWPGL